MNLILTFNSTLVSADYVMMTLAKLMMKTLHLDGGKIAIKCYV